MTERRIDEARNWKAVTFPYDVFIPDETEECQFCLTRNQAMFLRGLLEPAAWVTRWWSDEGEVSKDETEAFVADMTRRLMMSCCGDEIPVQYRYSDEGVLQKSEDGGATWEDAPENDVRVNSPQFPPVPGEPSLDKKCIAAASAALLIQEQVGDQLTDDMSRFTLGELIDTWVQTMIATSNPLQALLTVITNQIFALVIATLRPALTSDVYHLLQCILYCNMSADISVNLAQWGQIRSDILSQITGIAGVFLEHLIYLLGTQGTTNLIRSGAATEGDCSDCDCPGDCGLDWIPYSGYGASMTTGEDGIGKYIQGVPELHSGAYYLIIHSIDPDQDNNCCDLQQAKLATGENLPGTTALLYVACGVHDDGGHFIAFSSPVSCHVVQINAQTADPVRIYFTS